MSGTTPATRLPYQYVVLRCVPRVEREEFLNVGVVLYCPEADYLASASRVDPARVEALAPGFDVVGLRSALAAVEAVCRGEAHASYAAALRATAYGTREAVDTPGTRFGLLKAPRSTVLQPGPVHGGVTDDPAGTLAHLLERLVD
ncbi:DUF3037 domain-containing protein [Nocardioides sambongensis]|uniref:DUF3037 domain-containing protein n=1 Tax=Nocardioides sambongensis TaxID=2589074 RepID=UPI00112C8ED3|nr:DUF3037 domain-containing protein [Nocardioides sambongensis]